MRPFVRDAFDAGVSISFSVGSAGTAALSKKQVFSTLKSTTVLFLPTPSIRLFK
jgi:hypothetical protein